MQSLDTMARAMDGWISSIPRKRRASAARLAADALLVLSGVRGAFLVDYGEWSWDVEGLEGLVARVRGECECGSLRLLQLLDEGSGELLGLMIASDVALTAAGPVAPEGLSLVDARKTLAEPRTCDARLAAEQLGHIEGLRQKALALIAQDPARSSLQLTLPHRASLCTLIGWLLEFPALYVVEAGRAAGNCLGSQELLLCSCELTLTVGAGLRPGLQFLRSRSTSFAFSAPAALHGADDELLRRYLRLIETRAARHSEGDVAWSVASSTTSVELDSVAL